MPSHPDLRAMFEQLTNRSVPGGQGADRGAQDAEVNRQQTLEQRNNPFRPLFNSSGIRTGEAPYFANGWEQATPEEIAVFIDDEFLQALGDPAEATFAIRVATGESSLNRNARGDGGRSHGIWQLFEEGLLPDFMDWANESGEDANPYNPIAATRYVAQFIAGNGPAAWQNWSVAKQLLADPNSNPFDTTSTRGRDPEARGLDVAQTANLRERSQSERLGRPLSVANLQEGQDDRASINRRAAVNALVQSLPFTGNPGNEFAPGFGPTGPAARLAQMLGVGFAPQRIGPTQTLPLSQLANQPNQVSPDAIQQLMALL